MTLGLGVQRVRHGCVSMAVSRWLCLLLFLNGCAAVAFVGRVATMLIPQGISLHALALL